MASVYDVDMEVALGLHSQGLTDRAIAKRMEVPHWTIGRALRKVDVPPNGRTRGVRIECGDMSKCFTCGEWKKTETFPKNNYGILASCRTCRTIQSREAINADPRRYLADKYGRTKVRARKKSIAFSIEKEAFVEQFFAQNGLCFYTDRVMLTTLGSGLKSLAASVDKIIPERGYVEGNIVFCTQQANTIKNNLSLDEMAEWMPAWRQRLARR